MIRIAKGRHRIRPALSLQPCRPSNEIAIITENRLGLKIQMSVATPIFGKFKCPYAGARFAVAQRARRGCAYRLSHPIVVPMETAARRPGRLDCAISWLVQKTLPEPGDLRTLPHPGRATSTVDNLLGPPAGTTWYRVRADFLGPAPHHQPGWYCRDVWRDQACKHYPDSGFARKYCGFV